MPFISITTVMVNIHAQNGIIADFVQEVILHMIVMNVGQMIFQRAFLPVQIGVSAPYGTRPKSPMKTSPVWLSTKAPTTGKQGIKFLFIAGTNGRNSLTTNTAVPYVGHTWKTCYPQKTNKI